MVLQGTLNRHHCHAQRPTRTSKEASPLSCMIIRKGWPLCPCIYQWVHMDYDVFYVYSVKYSNISLLTLKYFHIFCICDKGSSHPITFTLLLFFFLPILCYIFSRCTSLKRLSVSYQSIKQGFLNFLCEILSTWAVCLHENAKNCGKCSQVHAKTT